MNAAPPLHSANEVESVSVETEHKRPTLVKILRRLVPIICLGVAGNLAYTWFSNDRKPIDFSKFSFVWLFVAMLLALLPWAWHSLRLAIWGQFFGVKIEWKNLLCIAMAADVGGVVAPTAIGGAPLKLFMLVQHGYRPSQAATLTLWGNIEDILFYLFAIPVSLALTDNWHNPLWIGLRKFVELNSWKILMVLAGLGALLFFIKNRILKKGAVANWRKKIRHFLSECKEAFRLVVSKGKKPFLLSFLALTGQWLTRFCILLAVVKILGFEADLVKLLLLQWMVFVAMLLTPTPGATGGAEAAFLLVFTASLPEGTASMVMAGWRFIAYYFIMIIGAVYLGSSTFRPSTNKQNEVYQHAGS